MSAKLKYLFLFLLLCSALVNAYAGDAPKFSDPHIPLPPATTGIAFFTVTSPVDDRILSVQSDCCAAAELHEGTMENGVMRMRQLENVPLKAGEPTNFAPGGLHVMLIGLKKPLAAGDTVPLTFTFAHAPKQTVVFTVADRH